MRVQPKCTRRLGAVATSPTMAKCSRRPPLLASLVASQVGALLWQGGATLGERANSLKNTPASQAQRVVQDRWTEPSLGRRTRDIAQSCLHKTPFACHAQTIMEISHAILLTNAAVSFYNLGTIWFAQVVVYPLFHQVGEGEYIDYHRDYARRIPLPVILPGALSFTLPVVLAFFRPESVPTWIVIANALCAGVSLFVTVLLAIPRHSLLESAGKQPQVIQDLIACNWPRTAAILVSAGLTLIMVLLAFKPV
jgi:hypothetical protein